MFAKIGALLGVVLIAAFCTEPAGASLKRVIIVDRLDTGPPAWSMSSRPIPLSGRPRSDRRQIQRNFVRGRVALRAILSCSECRDGARLIGVLLRESLFPPRRQPIV